MINNYNNNNNNSNNNNYKNTYIYRNNNNSNNNNNMMMMKIIISILIFLSLCCPSNAYSGGIGRSMISISGGGGGGSLMRNNNNYIMNSGNSSFVALTASVAGAASQSIAVANIDQLTYLQTMTAGAISRTIAQTFMHPANTYKTMLQLKDTGKSTKLTLERLLRGADAQFLLSLPHGAFHFFVIDQVKIQLAKFLPSKLNFFADFTASAISTVVCSIVSTPQMVLTDRLMAGVYPSFPDALKKIWKNDGILGFYSGWWPALAQKIPSYALTWMFFQQLKRLHEDILKTSTNTETNFAFGAIAAAGSVAVMIPMDTVKTRLVIQEVGCPRPYKGVTDCFIRVLKEEGIGTFYRSLPPRLMSVVPMIAIQFGVYEIMKAKFLKDNLEERLATARKRREVRLERRSQVLAAKEKVGI
jgi:solute carrier family 25 S-adenosylmethionine transporter 26